jgi:micrococcal nuclease
VRFKNQAFRCLIIAALISANAAATQPTVHGKAEQSKEGADDRREIRKVIRVVDGDTIVVSPNEKVRLIGVDTPETVHPKKIVECFGRDAKEFTRRAVEGKTIRLVLDDVNRVRRHKDRYGRTLAYAYLEDGRMLNRELIRQGYAHAYTRFRFRYRVEFRQLEHAARDQAVGLWSSCGIQ